MRNNLTRSLFVFLPVMLVAGCKTNPQYPELEATITDSLKKTTIGNVFIASFTAAKARPKTDFRCIKRCANRITY